MRSPKYLCRVSAALLLAGLPLAHGEILVPLQGQTQQQIQADIAACQSQSQSSASSTSQTDAPCSITQPRLLSSAWLHSASRPPGSRPSTSTAAPLMDITTRASVGAWKLPCSAGSSKNMTLTTRR